jgi:hypothetical protein
VGNKMMIESCIKRRSVMRTLLILVCAIVAASGCTLLENGQRPLHNPEAIATLAPLPTPGPRSGFIKDVSPPESSTIPLSVYRANIDEHMMHEGVRFENVGFADSVCVALDMGPVLEDGDRLTDWQDVLNRMSIEIDGTLLTELSPPQAAGLEPVR